MMILLELLEKAIWAGLAAMGFAILFNVPRRTLFAIWALGAVGGLVKFTALNCSIDIVLASLLGASAIGILSVPTAHKWYSPPLVFAIPAVIPMVPGAFAYNMMLGFMDLATTNDSKMYASILMDTVRNGSKALFILMSLATGVAVPMLVTRKESIKKIEHHK
ncbi:MAG: threonine/serine exporter family protein [Marinifilaceae bacterium]